MGKRAGRAQPAKEQLMQVWFKQNGSDEKYRGHE
jgi:hypothetical protein